MRYQYEYELEELLPIVAELTGKYTRGESTSVTYERANQLMGAVMYCINECGRAMREAKKDIPHHTKAPMQELSAGKLTAREAYEAGYIAVVNKVRRAISLYNEIMEDFDDYGNICIRDTVAVGMPEFFRWYDPKFAPQDTILTLDYPVAAKWQRLQGIDAIYKYLQSIHTEQRLLGRLERSEVIRCLEQYSSCYEDLIENLYEIVRRADDEVVL